MPYIFVDEVPEGSEVADVVPRADYDSVVGERDETIRQRDDALNQIESARKEVREAKAQYADAILSANRNRGQEPKKEENTRPSMATTVTELFK